MFVSPAKMAEPIKMPFGGLTCVGPKKHVLDVGSAALRVCYGCWVLQHLGPQFWGLQLVGVVSLL